MVTGMSAQSEKLGNDLMRDGESGALSRAYDAILFVAVLAFSAVALLAFALAAPLALAVSAVSGAASALFAGPGRRGGWQTAGSA